MLIFLLILLLAGLGGFGYWAYTKGYFKGLIPSDNTTQTSQGVKNTTPPKINNITVDMPAIDGFWVKFDTDKPSNCYIEYGTKGGALSSKTEAEKDKDGKAIYPITSHAIALKSLAKNTEYQYRIVAKTLDGAEGKSEAQDAKTAND
jgi:flagellar basal body-associated protein FliL